jgi:cytosine/adenosine deaminase-related metal-dependent hydrolase
VTRILLRGAQVVSLAPNRPDSERVDILIEDDRISAMSEYLDPTGADVVDLTYRIVIPGLVNAHLHTWQTALRFAGGDWSLLEYLAHTHGHVARRYSHHDMHIGTLAGALNQINCGTTTLGDWCHNCLTPDHTDAAIDALTTAGIRAVFLHGTPHGGPTKPHDVREIDRLLDGPIANSALLTAGMAIKGPQLSAPDVVIADLRAALERGVIASMHQSAGTPGHCWNAVGAAGLWGPHANIVHGTGLTDEWVKKLADAGVTFTTTPENELGQGHCTAITEQLLRAGAAPSLGTDTETAVSGEVLTAARITLACQRGLTHEQEFYRTGLSAPTAALTSKHALSWATVHGARARPGRQGRPPRPRDASRCRRHRRPSTEPVAGPRSDRRGVAGQHRQHRSGHDRRALAQAPPHPGRHGHRRSQRPAAGVGRTIRPQDPRDRSACPHTTPRRANCRAPAPSSPDEVR